ncbi:MAG TPA: YHYH protein [Tepidisphaeraceae bacterium]|jgi:hypothetical protein
MSERQTIKRRMRQLAAAVVLGIGGAAVGHEGAHSHKGADGEELPKSEVSIVEEGAFRVITANGVPDHSEGHRNPGKVQAQQYRFRVPLNPKPADQPTPLRHAPFGVAVNGVVFDPSTNEFWKNDRNWMYDALSGKVELGMDANHAHVQPGGKYHYHGLPTALLERLGADKKMALVGWAADGFPIYGPMAYTDANDPKSPLKAMKPSYRLKKEARPSGKDGPGGKPDGTFFVDWEYEADLGDLDECNGRTGVTPEFPAGMYYYVLTKTFPFVPRQWNGTPDASFLKRPGNGGPPRDDVRGERREGGPRDEERRDGERRPRPPRRE